MQNRKNLIISTIILIVALSAIVLSLTTKIVYIKACTDGSYPIFDFEKSFGIIEYIKEDIFFSYNLYYIFDTASGPMWLVLGSIISNILPLISTAILCVATVVEIIYAFTKRTLAHKNSLIKPLAIFTGIFYLIICVFCFVGYTINNSMANGYMEFYTDTGFYINALVGLALIILPCFLGNKEKEPNVNKTKNIILYALTSTLSIVFALLLLSNQFSVGMFPGNMTTIFGLSKYTIEHMSELNLPFEGDLPCGFSQYAMFLIFIALGFVFVYSIIALMMTIANKNTNWLSIRIKRWAMAVVSITCVLYFLVICATCVYLTNLVWNMGGGEYYYALTETAPICFVMPFVISLITRLIPAKKKQKEEN